MPVATGTAIALGVSAAAAAGSTAVSIGQAREGRRRQKRAQKALDAYQRQELTNVYAGLTAPVEGFRLRQEQVKADIASQTEALSRAGARGLVGGLPQVQDYSERAFAQIGADLEQTQFRIQQMIAEDEARIRGLQEERERADIAGLGAEIQAGRQQRYQGIQQAIGSVGALGQSAAGFFPGAGAATGAAQQFGTQQRALNQLPQGYTVPERFSRL